MSNRWHHFDRCYLGQIRNVDVSRGCCTVVVPELQKIESNVELPWFALAMQGQRSSWIRYMPQARTIQDLDENGNVVRNEYGEPINSIAGDTVLVAFDATNTMHILGYGARQGTMEAFYGAKTRNPTLMPSGDLVQLQQGEWDMRSSGGAYIYGDRFGNLKLSAGPTSQIRLDKPRNEAKAESGLWMIGGNGSFIRYGDVKRKLVPSDLSETDVSDIDPTAPKEYWNHIEVPVAGVASTIIADEHLGAVRDEFGVPFTNGITPLRYRKKIWSIGSSSLFASSVYSEETDALGNHEIEAFSYDVNSDTTASVHGNVKATISSDARVTIDSANPIAGVGLGGDLATHPVMYGDVYVTNNTPVWLATATLSTALSTLMPLLIEELEATPTTKPDLFAALTGVGTAATALTAILGLLPAASAPGVMSSFKVVTE